MASDNILLWYGSMFVSWFFLCSHNEERFRILGWMSMFLISLGGVTFNAGGDNPIALMMGGMLMMVSLIKVTNLFTGSEDPKGEY